MGLGDNGLGDNGVGDNGVGDRPLGDNDTESSLPGEPSSGIALKYVIDDDYMGAIFIAF